MPSVAHQKRDSAISDVLVILLLIARKHGERSAVGEDSVFERVTARPFLVSCWIRCKLWEELGLGEFWQQALGLVVVSGASVCRSQQKIASL